MKGKYDDIIDLPHPVSKTHGHMSRADRAAQFAAFAALTGYEAVVRESARLTDRRQELDETEQALLDEKLRLLREQDRPMAEITWFCADKKKPGGSYVTSRGILKKIDEQRGLVILEDGTAIPVRDIRWVE